MVEGRAVEFAAWHGKAGRGEAWQGPARRGVAQQSKRGGNSGIMFWIGLGVGIFIGFFLGMLTLGLCVLAREADEQSERLLIERR